MQTGKAMYATHENRTRPKCLEGIYANHYTSAAAGQDMPIWPNLAIISALSSRRQQICPLFKYHDGKAAAPSVQAADEGHNTDTEYLSCSKAVWKGIMNDQESSQVLLRHGQKG